MLILIRSRPLCGRRVSPVNPPFTAFRRRVLHIIDAFPLLCVLKILLDLQSIIRPKCVSYSHQSGYRPDYEPTHLCRRNPSISRRFRNVGFARTSRTTTVSGVPFHPDLSEPSRALRSLKVLEKTSQKVANTVLGFTIYTTTFKIA